MVLIRGSAAGQRCPAYLGPVLRTHWGFDDPGHVVGTEKEIEMACEETYKIISAWSEAFLALPLNALQGYKTKSKAELDRIGTPSA